MGTADTQAAIRAAIAASKATQAAIAAEAARLRVERDAKLALELQTAQGQYRKQ
ncbi:MAG: hypothetical protein ACRDOE_00230 [Streptosporangiaceae bacterium]